MFLISQYRLRPVFVYIALMTQFLCLELICLSDKGLVNSTHKRDRVLYPCHKNLDYRHVLTNGLLLNLLHNSYLCTLYIQTKLFFVSTEPEVYLAHPSRLLFTMSLFILFIICYNSFHGHS